jgi:hypothetical protein
LTGALLVHFFLIAKLARVRRVPMRCPTNVVDKVMTLKPTTEVLSHRDEALTSQEGHDYGDPSRLDGCKGGQCSIQQRDKVMVRPQLVVQRLGLKLCGPILHDTRLVKLR